MRGAAGEGGEERRALRGEGRGGERRETRKRKRKEKRKIGGVIVLG